MQSCSKDDVDKRDDDDENENDDDDEWRNHTI